MSAIGFDEGHSGTAEGVGRWQGGMKIEDSRESWLTEDGCCVRVKVWRRSDLLDWPKLWVGATAMKVNPTYEETLIE